MLEGKVVIDLVLSASVVPKEQAEIQKNEAPLLVMKKRIF